MSFAKQLLAAASALALTGAAYAGVTQTTGAGSAVTTVQAQTGFDDVASLNATFSEDGIDFARVGLSSNNNSCGYAGCPGWLGFTGFSGNYLYGTGSGYLDIKAGSGSFNALEFVAGTGFFSATTSVVWSAYLGGALIDSGSTNVATGTVVGFRDSTGFDELRYTGGNDGFNAPALDTLTASFTSSVPEPGSISLMLAGIGALFIAHRRRA